MFRQLLNLESLIPNPQSLIPRPADPLRYGEIQEDAAGRGCTDAGHRRSDRAVCDLGSFRRHEAELVAAARQPAATSTTPDDFLESGDPGGRSPRRRPVLAEVLRFDVTASWVMQHWPRVSTGLPYLQLQGYRVALVTGTRVTDLAGSLTYYFNAQQKVQRITFRGTTGDPSALVTLLTGRYGFARRVLNDPSVVLYEAVDSGNQPIGSVKIRSAQVIEANQPYRRFEVELVMDRAE